MEEAEALLHESLDIRKAAWTEEHPGLGVGHEKLGVFYARTGKNKESERHLRESLRIALATRAADSERVAALRCFLAAPLCRSDDGVEEGEALARTALKRFRELFPEDHSRIGEGLLALGACQLRRQSFGEAEISLTQAVENMRHSYGEKSQRTAAAQEILDRLYSAWGKQPLATTNPVPSN